MDKQFHSSNLPPPTSNQLTRWLITGGCGFIGRNLIKALVAEGGHSIRIVDNLKVGTREDLAQVCNFQELSPSDLASSPDLSPLPSDLSPLTSHLFPLPSSLSSPVLIVADILDADLALKLCEGIDIVIHLAANTGVAPSVENPRMDCLNNVIGTLNYLEAARHNKVKRFVFASSGAPVGECTPPIHEEMPCHPVSPYGASKLAGEAYCSAYYRSFGLETVCLRFGNVYGPFSGKKDSVVAKFIKQAMAGEPVEIYGDGNQTRDFIYVADLIEAIYKSATLHLKRSAYPLPSPLSPLTSHDLSLSSVLSPQTFPIGGEIFQIATNKETTVGEMVELLIPVLNEKGIKDIRVIYGEKRIGDVMRNFSDTTKAARILKWKCSYSLEEGLSETVKYFMATAGF